MPFFAFLLRCHFDEHLGIDCGVYPQAFLDGGSSVPLSSSLSRILSCIMRFCGLQSLVSTEALQDSNRLDDCMAKLCDVKEEYRQLLSELIETLLVRHGHNM